MGSVNITLAQGQLGGQVQTDDNTTGLAITGVSGADYTLGETVLVTSLAGAKQAGFTEAADPFIYKQLKEFFEEAGDGVKLYVLPVSSALLLSDVVSDDDSYLQHLLNDNQDISVVAALCNDDTVWDGDQSIQGINNDVYLSVTRMQGVLATFAAAQRPMRGVIGGTSFTGVVGDLGNLTNASDYNNGTDNRVAVVVGDTAAGNGAAVGKLLGRIAKVPVMRKVSRVKDGAIAQTIYYGNDLAITRQADVSVITGKGYITMKQYAGVGGFFFTGDPTATATTDDYCTLANGRVIDKAQKVVYKVYVNEVDDEIPTVAGGYPEPGWAKTIEAKATTALTNAMLIKGEVSSVRARVPLDQVVIGEGATFNIAVGLRPVGYLTDIEIVLGFEL